MKKYIISIFAALLCAACNDVKEMTVRVENPIEMNREGELVEISMDDVVERLHLPDTAQVIVIDEDGEQVPCQITFDDRLIFPVRVDASSSVSYTIRAGQPQTFSTRVCGNFYPEREDDVAWENDVTAFRAYGPAFERAGYKAFGYDVWTKYNTSEPVLEERYASELNPAINEKIKALRESDPEKAEQLYRTISYHVDHGNGMDCYVVGPTLGGGAAALMVNNEIIYPGCYATQDILDNGPLRFSVLLTYNPITVEGDTNVIENRLISLDAGSYLNKTIVKYDNLSKDEEVITGIVLHEADGDVVADASTGYISYVDPTDGNSDENGKIFVGAAFPDRLKDARRQLFSEKERTEKRGGAYGHVIAVSDYQPGDTYIYYWGAAWNKSAIKTPEEWNSYLADYATKLKNPLKVIIE
jgi:hypothetical protein